MTYGVLGVGAIAEAIVTGLCADAAPAVLLSPRNALRAQRLAARFASVEVAADNQAVVDGADTIVVCVRPQEAAVLTDLRFHAGQAVISVMAGVSLERLRTLVAPATELSRAIPLPSVATRSGVTPIHPASVPARTLFDALGGAIEVTDAAAFDAFSASTATIAAHFAYLDAIATWLTTRGVPPAAATSYVASVFSGLASTDEHATPGGINEQFLASLRDAGVFETVRTALDEVEARLRSAP